MDIDEMRANPEAAQALIARSEKSPRNQEIAMRAVRGETLAEIALDVGLSRTRVHQIVHGCVNQAKIIALRDVAALHRVDGGDRLWSVGFSVRIEYTMYKIGIYHTEHLRAVIEREGADFLDRIPNIGPKAKREILGRLAIMPA